MSIHKFQRPELDDEILTAMEQLEHSRKALKFFMEQRSAILRVRAALGHGVRASLLETLDEDVVSLDHEIEVAEVAAGDWQEIQDILVARSRRS